MAEITETRTVKFEEKIFSLNNVHIIANSLVDILNKIRLSNCADRSELTFSVLCHDANFESHDAAIFSTNSILAHKRIQQISMRLRSYGSQGDISITITHGNAWPHNNRIIVSGNDSVWVNGNLKKLEDIIHNTPPQNTFIKKWEPVIKPIFALSIGFALTQLISLFINAPTIDSQSQLAASLKANIVFLYIVQYFLYYISGYFPACALMDKLKSLWPSIEIQIGPEHTFIEKIRRKWIATALTIGVLPLVTSVIYDAVKRLGSGS